MNLFFKNNKNRLKMEDEGLILDEKSGFSIQEAYKALRTNIMYSLPGSGSKCIGITSATQGNGKSTNALNLAIVFSQIEKKVLVIDADLRLPTIASKLNIKGDPGLSNVLTELSDLKECIQHDEKHNIDVLPSGIIPPDATILLQSKQMKELVAKLKEEYDYIFIDLPPVLVTIDAVLVSELVDGFLLIVQHGVSEYRSVSAMINQMKYSGARILGLVYAHAGVEGRKKAYAHYGYYQKNKNDGHE